MSLFRRVGIGLKGDNVGNLQRRHPRGTRYGPKLALDGGRIWQRSSTDITKIINKKKLTQEEFEEYYERGIITEWIENPKKRKKKKMVEVEVATGWHRYKSRRVGALGIKIGMNTEIDMWGVAHPVSLVQLQDNLVMQMKTQVDHQKEKEIYTLQIGAGLKKWHSLNKAQMGQFAKLDCPPKAKIAEFKVTKDAIVPVGTPILITHFVPGQFVDVKGKTRGKGFQGVMKRWGFSGGPASHGSSKFHRKPGSIAAGKTDGGRTWKGKKMPGRMGGDMSTILSLQIMKINTEDSILYIKGNVPGPKGGWLEIRDSIKRLPRLPPPFPTHMPEIQPQRPAITKKYLRIRYPDPFRKNRMKDWDQEWRNTRAALKSATEGDEDDDEEDEEDLDADLPPKK